jgi:hypothetical protein
MQMFLCKPPPEFFIRRLKIFEGLLLIPNSPPGFLERVCFQEAMEN